MNLDRMKVINKILLGLLFSTPVLAQESIHYSGNTLVNVDYHHGQLRPVVGTHNIQIMRADRAVNHGWTYNHAPMLAYWNNTFYVEYLSDEVSESVPPGQTLLLRSTDGVNWSAPDTVFPVYRIPDGPVKNGVAKDLNAVMHQRMGFYTSKSNHLLVLGYYGICLDPKDDPNDGNGIGRVVREILPDGSYGPIYFIRYNKQWKDKGKYPFYTSSKNKAFVAACNELLATPLMMQQWVEEADRDDPLIPLQKQYKAFCYYHLPDKRVVGLWKNALTGMSNDEGRTWSTVARAPGFVNANAKIWGQRTSDGRYATVYNPSEYRWPLALSVSQDGIDYTNLLLVNGEIPPMRYGGNYKSYGPQYVRGMEEGNGSTKDLWVTYSMNKEDIWVAKIPVPITDKVTQHLPGNITSLDTWNIYSPLWAPVKLTNQGLQLQDKDPYDYAKAEHMIPASRQLSVDFSVQPVQGLLQIELQDGKGMPGFRLIFDADTIRAKAGARYKNFMQYKADSIYNFHVEVNTANRFYTIEVNGKEVLKSLLYAPLDSVERIVFRTGEPRHFPDADTPADQYYDLPQQPETKNTIFYIRSLKTSVL
jgi:hypothetical protein